MSIRQMLPVGTHLRKCIVCGYPITAKGNELTAHEMQCLGLPMPEGAKIKLPGSGPHDPLPVGFRSPPDASGQPEGIQ
jgi:hypothetical protein